MEHHKNIIEYFFLNMQMLGFIFLSAYTNNHYFFFNAVKVVVVVEQARTGMDQIAKIHLKH